jgi:hypothetical protein
MHHQWLGKRQHVGRAGGLCSEELARYGAWSGVQLQFVGLLSAALR